jgi:hypothetical protein
MDGRGPLATKLSRFVPLSNEDVRILDALCRNEERFEAHTDIVCQGDVPGSAFVLTRGDGIPLPAHARWQTADSNFYDPR